MLTNKQRADGVYQWQQRLLRLGRRIVAIERRARASAGRRGKAAEVSAATGEGEELREMEKTEPSAKDLELSAIEAEGDGGETE